MKNNKYFLLPMVLLSVLFFSTPVVQSALAAAAKTFNQITSYALRDPFYPDYPQRRFLFPTNALSWWGVNGLNKYTITSKDPRVGNRSVTFYSSGYYQCASGIEMGLPFGNAPGSSYSHIACGLSASDDFNFLFPSSPVTTAQTVISSPALITSAGGLNATIYLPSSWWNN